MSGIREGTIRNFIVTTAKLIPILLIIFLGIFLVRNDLFFVADWHPEDSIYFEKWSPHRIANTCGVDFHPNLKIEKIGLKLQKGTANKENGYSAFEATNAFLPDFLRRNNISNLYVCGLATDP